MFDHINIADLVTDYMAVKDFIHAPLVGQEFVNAHPGELFSPVNEEEGIYRRFYVDLSPTGMIGARARIHENTLDIWRKGRGLSELSVKDIERMAQLNDMAMDVEIESMPNIMADMTGMPRDNFESAQEMLVITNASRQFGASALFMPGVEETLNERFPDGFIILPSSVHEVIVIDKPKTLEDLKSADEMVYQINRAEVSPEERLADCALTMKDGKIMSATKEMEKELAKEREQKQQRKSNIRKM